MLAPSRRRRETLVSRLFPWRRRKAAYSTLVMNESDFRFQIEKERSRADRRGIEFSLIKFRVDKQKTAAEKFEGLLASFKSRMRITDDLGVFEDCLSVLLPDTPGDGACKVALELSDIASEQGIDMIPQVFVYPDDLDKGVFEMESGNRTLLPQHSNGVQSQSKEPNDFDDDSEESGGKTHETNGQQKSRISLEAEPLRFSNAIPLVKRTFDVFAASCGLIAFSPVFVGVAILIKTTSSGPVFFRQMREGKDGSQFNIFKFRTMVVDAESQKEALLNSNEQDGPAFKIENDPRLTGLGSLLRKTCIDELPQLINVLRGEMSMVGPRPLPVAESIACKNWQRKRLNVLPGMTCIWQVEGGRNVSFDDWMRMDLDYINKSDLRFDLKLLIKTASVALFAKGSV